MRRFLDSCFLLKNKITCRRHVQTEKKYTKFLSFWIHPQTNIQRNIKGSENTIKLQYWHPFTTVLTRKPILRQHAFLRTGIRRGCTVIKSSQHSFHLAMELFFLSVYGCVNSQNNGWCCALNFILNHSTACLKRRSLWRLEFSPLKGHLQEHPILIPKSANIVITVKMAGSRWWSKFSANGGWRLTVYSIDVFGVKQNQSGQVTVTQSTWYFEIHS